jgi:hypothetical protein
VVSFRDGNVDSDRLDRVEVDRQREHRAAEGPQRGLDVEVGAGAFEASGARDAARVPDPPHQAQT